MTALRWAFTRFAYVFPLIFAVFAAVQVQRTDRERDTVVYHHVAEQAQSDGTIYDPLPPDGPHVPGLYYIYPPPFAAAVGLLPRMEFAAFARAWLAVLLAAFWVTAAFLGRLAAGAWTLRATLVWGAILFFTPGTVVALNVGNADVLLWLSVAVAFLGSSVGAGAAFFTGALVKPFLVWPLFAALLRPGRGRVLAGVAVAAVAALLLSALVLGPGRFLGESLVWVRDVLPSLGQGQLVPREDRIKYVLAYFLPENLSISAAPLRLVSDGTTPLPDWARLWLLASSIAAPLAATWLLRHRSAAVHYGGTLAAALLFAPIFRPTYLPMLLPLVAVWWRERAVRTGAQVFAQRETASRISIT